MTEDDYKNTLSRLVTGVTLVVARPHPNHSCQALTVNSFTSVSLSPPIIQWCLDRTSRSWQRFADIETFSVNILAQSHCQHARRHANADTQHLETHQITTTKTGTPMLASALAAIDCRLRQHVEMGDHRVFFADVVAVVRRDGAPLCYYRGSFGSFGPV